MHTTIGICPLFSWHLHDRKYANPCKQRGPAYSNKEYFHIVIYYTPIDAGGTRDLINEAALV
jgi:hypothetical protein